MTATAPAPTLGIGTTSGLLSPGVEEALNLSLSLAEMVVSVELPGSGPMIALAIQLGQKIIQIIEDAKAPLTDAQRTALHGRTLAMIANADKLAGIVPPVAPSA